MKINGSSFKVFVITRYYGVDSPKGDLAEDILRDPNFTGSTQFKVIFDYLRQKGACSEALATFIDVYDEYIEWKALIKEASR